MVVDEQEIQEAADALKSPVYNKIKFGVYKSRIDQTCLDSLDKRRSPSLRGAAKVGVDKLIDDTGVCIMCISDTLLG